MQVGVSGTDFLFRAGPPRDAHRLATRSHLQCLVVSGFDMLCDVCNLMCQRLSGDVGAAHHETYADLRDSAANGCEFCAFSRTTILEHYAQSLRCSTAEAEQFHIERDSFDAASNRDFSGFEVGLSHVRTRRDNVGVRGLWLGRSLRGDHIGWLKDVAPAFVHMSVPSDDPMNRFIGRKISALPDICVGKSWIDECSKNHKSCGTTVTPELPTRVLDVGMPNGTTEPRLILSLGQAALYATLSYCWGGQVPLVTTSESLNQHLSCLPFATLPQTFKDAVTVTRQLGLQYLWIDALCILQDSTQDWEQQCALIPRIYRDSTVTISAVAAPISGAGFLGPRRPLLTGQLHIENDYINQNGELSYWGPDENAQSGPIPEDSQMKTRGWVFQERLLSRRVLYFGRKQMYWECYTHVRYECLSRPFTDWQLIRGEVEKVSFQLRDTKNDWPDYWLEVVETYSKLNLTFRKDKLPALSGVASEMQKIFRGKYMAGLWLNNIAQEMCWYTPYKDLERPKTASADLPLPYVAPTWSWASAEHGIKFHKSESFRADIETLFAESATSKDNPFGEVQSASLKLRGRIIDAKILKTGVNLKSKFASFNDPNRDSLFVCLKGANLIGAFHPDRAWATSNSSSIPSATYTMEFLLLGDYRPVRPGNYGPGNYGGNCGRGDGGGGYGGTSARHEWHWVALALESVPGVKNQFHRVGLAFGDTVHFPVTAELFNGVKRREIKLV
ncbi:hypothetical protein GALMADRAFT_711074 [Galerina marginata CBS 339.88]|uniref:Heterokaryon incompatibility domain-containing protein n=1 Tax=Galerina marginata (strain CBS 339.88) TaxID=685588 RepID=A0A067TMK1_GALM3|nr:hypothetical protein GALMADRAFT_711074 [Galerina marginata CBS 339.88]